MATPAGFRVMLRRDDSKSDLSQLDVSDLNNDYKVPPPKYRHAAPSAPWPWMEFDQDEAEVRPLTPLVSEDVLWAQYPTSHFGNWTSKQVDRCRMLTICKDNYECQIHKVEVCRNGDFLKLEEAEQTRKIVSEPAVARAYWDELQKPLDPNLRVQALFIETITFNVLKILGARYDIEPFFFASSANWIPSRYQENPHPRKGDHITVVLPFVRAVSNERLRSTPLPAGEVQHLPGKAPITDKNQTIDTQAPLVLSERKILLQDLLAIHMVRNTETNVIISYHHHSQFQKTTAKRLQSLVQRTGDSVYWSKIYHKTKDPTFVFLSILWYPLYAWDEALEELYAHLTKQLETTRAENAVEHTALTRELHKLQAHLLYYQQLLRDFSKSVEFVRNTHNPAMNAESITDTERETSKKAMELEADNLLAEIGRLEKQREIQSDRLDNAIRLAFATVNISDSYSMQQLTKATLKDSAAMKQISYLTVVFLPASFLASVFGMNVMEINPGTSETLLRYIESTVILTVITAWFVIALQEHSSFHKGGHHYVERVLWPAFYGYRFMGNMMIEAKGRYRLWRLRRRA